MMEKYGLFDSVDSDERLYAEADLAILVKALGADGVRGGEGALRVSAADSGLGVSVAAGAALIQGRYYALEDDGSGEKLLALSAAASNPRIDRIVLALEYGSRTVGLRVLKGAEAASPAAPSLVRSGDVYMLSLAQVHVGVGVSALTASDITDERPDETLCGLHIASVSEAMEEAQGKAPKNHAASDKTYGTGSALLYGHVRLSDSVEETTLATAGVAATPKAVRLAYLKGVNAYNLADSKTAIQRTIGTLYADGWSDGPPYTQSIESAAFLASDCPVLDLDGSGLTADTAQELLENYSRLDYIESASGAYKVYCYREKPTVDLPVFLLTIRA